VRPTPLAALERWGRRVFAFDGDPQKSRRRASLALIGVSLLTTLPLGRLGHPAAGWGEFRTIGLVLGAFEFALLWAVRRPGELLWGVIVGVDVAALWCNALGLHGSSVFLIGAPFVGTLWVSAYMPTRTATLGVCGYATSMTIALARLGQGWAMLPLVLGRVALLVLVAVLVRGLLAALRRTTADLRAAQTAAEALARTDPLTGLANRRRLVGAASTRRRSGQTGDRALILVDLDHFKAVNDTVGHASGDAVLVDVAHRLADLGRDRAVVSRWGGEEFLLLAHAATDGRLLAAELLHEVRGRPVVLPGGGQLSVTISVGIARWPDGTPFEKALAAADSALYTAKADGRDCRVETGWEEVEGQQELPLDGDITLPDRAEDHVVA
jgi:diguanylate cyclase (GGDEF)-like protein